MKKILTIFLRNNYWIDNWINEGSGWITESMDGEYVNVSIHSPLSESSYVKLNDQLKNSKNIWSVLKTKLASIFFGAILDIYIY